MQKKRHRRMSDRRRALVATRRVQLDELKSERFADIAREVSERLEPLIERLVKEQVSKAMVDFTDRQLESTAPCVREP